MHKILVLNSKGGCGKSTIATNLAGYYAAKGFVTSLIDFDSQGTSTKWLSLRGDFNPPIHGISAFSQHGEMTRSWQMRVSRDTDWVISDAPAGVSGIQLRDYVQRADTIVIPVLPSPIDIHAAAHFIQDVLIIGKINTQFTQMAVVANRVRENTRVYRDLRNFLASLKLPFIASLHDSQEYIRAAESGLSVYELKTPRSKIVFQHWAPMLAWLHARKTKLENSPRPNPFPILHNKAQKY